MNGQLTPLRVTGVVERGDQRGRELGFPTANLQVGHDVVRRDGVWAGLVQLVDRPWSQPWVTAVSVGRRPTFYDKDGVRLLEAHLVGFQGNLYGRPIEVELFEHLRPMRGFDSADALVRQLGVDVADTRAWAIDNGLGALLAERPQHHPRNEARTRPLNYADWLLAPLAAQR